VLDSNLVAWDVNTEPFFTTFTGAKREKLLLAALDPTGSPGFHFFTDEALFAPGPLLNALLYLLRLLDLASNLHGPLWTRSDIPSATVPEFISADFAQLSPETIEAWLDKLDRQGEWSAYLMGAWKQHQVAVRNVLMSGPKFILRKYLPNAPPVVGGVVKEHTHSALRSNDGTTPQDLHMDVYRMLALVFQVYLNWYRGQKQFLTDCGDSSTTFEFPPGPNPLKKLPREREFLVHMIKNQFSVNRNQCTNGMCGCFWACCPHRGIPASNKSAGSRSWKSFFMFTREHASKEQLFEQDYETQWFTFRLYEDLYPGCTPGLVDLVSETLLRANTTDQVSLDKVMQFIFGDSPAPLKNGGYKPAEHWDYQGKLIQCLWDKGEKLFMPCLQAGEVTRNTAFVQKTLKTYQRCKGKNKKSKK
jgi:hypothetical protein